jgi:superfamily II DNA/RNA helicase
MPANTWPTSCAGQASRPPRSTADLSQGARNRVLADLNSGMLRVVVATDMAARGLHIPGLSVVVNYDLPRSAVDYTHRIGRTGRAGATRLAVSFVSATTEAHFRLIEKRQGQRVPREHIAGFEPREAAAPASSPTGGIKGRRNSKKDKLREAAGRGG